MTHLMGYDIGKCEITARTDRLTHLFQKTQINIHRLVGRAIKRAGLRRRATATALHRTVEQHQFGRLIRQSAALKLFGPHILRSGKNRADKLLQLLILTVGHIRLLLRSPAAKKLSGIAHHYLKRITARYPGYESRHDHGSDATCSHLAATAPAILDVAALSASRKFHNAVYDYLHLVVSATGISQPWLKQHDLLLDNAQKAIMFSRYLHEWLSHPR